MKRTPGYKQAVFKITQSGSTRFTILFVLFLFLSIIAVFRLVERHAAADSSKITSGISGYCLDDSKDSAVANAVVDAWKCNDTVAQVWVANTDTITHDGKSCLTVDNNGKGLDTKVVLDGCDGSAGQVWLRDQGGYQNPNSNMCLSALISKPESQLFIDSCGKLSSSAEVWTPIKLNSTATDTNLACEGSEGNKVACNAEKEWTTWQSGTVNHETLLNVYTDGAPYEEWCADFVSYVYKESGYPFAGGETNGWDENIADNIQNMGFTKYSATSGYVPKAGDVAYFDYNGGHVEIVISGGKVPTFIYGDSATIDPTTGNGQMMANTIANDGNEGQVIYYLSPN